MFCLIHERGYPNDNNKKSYIPQKNNTLAKTFKHSLVMRFFFAIFAAPNDKTYPPKMDNDSAEYYIATCFTK